MTRLNDFCHGLRFEDLPVRVKATATRSLLDTLGVAAGGSGTGLSRIIRDHAVAQFGAGASGTARLWFDGRAVSPAGAALANGMTIDALDAHDGHKPTKGHIGCGVIPSLLGVLEAEGKNDPQELLAALVVGYEIGSRAGVALHRTVSDYHTSGAWVALAVAAVTARLLGLNAKSTREAVGIAEYHGPRSQMMRCIDHPTMVKDGSGWGAMAGVSAGYLARDGFTGAPALTVEQSEVSDLWEDLGSRWRIIEQYVKLYPVCRWAQPPVEAVLALRRAHGFAYQEIEKIDVLTFHEAKRLRTRHPRTTEAAQYSLPFSVAAALVRGTIGLAEVSDSGLKDPEIAALQERIKIEEDERFNAPFPDRRIAQVSVALSDGRLLTSEPTEAIGDPEEPVSDGTIREKFRGLAVPVLGAARAERLASSVQGLENADTTDALKEALSEPL